MKWSMVCGWVCTWASMCPPLYGRKRGILLPIKGRTHSRLILGTFEEMGHLDFDLSPKVG